MKRFAVIMLLAALCAPLLRAQDTSAQESKKAKLEREIKILEQQLKDNSTKSSSALTKLSLTRQKIDARKSLIKESDREITAFNDTIVKYQREVNRIQARLDTMTLYFNKLVKSAYKNRDARVWYMYLLASKNLGQAGKRYNYLRSLSSTMNSQASKIKETKAELQEKIGKVKGLRAEAKKLRDSRKLELDKLEKEEKDSNALIAQLKKDKNKYQKDLSKKKDQVNALNKEIQKIIAQAMNAGKKSGGKKVDYVLSGEFASNKGKLPWPAEGPVADHFGQHSHPVYKSVQLPFNNGVNISVSKGTKVQAVFDGEVKKIIVMPGYNKCVLVQHGDYFTFYCKLGSVSVKAGDKLKTGQTIGVVDTIDGQTQLHFQLWQEQKPQNPENWLRPR